MKSFKKKLALSGVAVAMLATPALAAHSHVRRSGLPLYDSVQAPSNLGVDRRPVYDFARDPSQGISIINYSTFPEGSPDYHGSTGP